MKITENENIAKYVERIKVSVSENRAFGGKIDHMTTIRKVLRTLIPIYEIKVSTI